MSIKNWTIGGLGALVLGLAASSLICKPCNDLARKVSGKDLPLFGRVNGNTQNKGSSLPLTFLAKSLQGLQVKKEAASPKTSAPRPPIVQFLIDIIQNSVTSLK